jgi:DNA-binding Lrp family transcriptional regulator
MYRGDVARPMRAFVLIRCEIDEVLSAVDELEEIDGVARVDAVTGKYDAVAEIDVEDTDEIRRIVAGEVHDTYGVIETTTCIAT